LFAKNAFFYRLFFTFPSDLCKLEFTNFKIVLLHSKHTHPHTHSHPHKNLHTSHPHSPFQPLLYTHTQIHTHIISSYLSILQILCFLPFLLRCTHTRTTRINSHFFKFSSLSFFHTHTHPLSHTHTHTHTHTRT
jgi:hypothetical protein